jgi:hypothetical protein
MRKFLATALFATLLTGHEVAFGQAPAAPGLQPLPGAPRGQIPGATGAAAAAGNIGEVQSTSASCVTTTGIAAGTTSGYAVMNLPLTAGTWLVSGVAGIDLASGTTLGTFDAVINATSGGGSGLVVGSPGFYNNGYAGITGGAFQANIPDQVLRFSTTTPVYLSYSYVTTTGGTAGQCGAISAVRIQ